MARLGHRPQRTCLGCGGKDEQVRLLRLTVDSRGELMIDRTAAGRGGYLHPRRECWNSFTKRKNTYRAFRMDLSKSVKEKFIEGLNEGSRE